MAFRKPLLAEATRPNHWRLDRDLVWRDGRRKFVVPKDFETDLASVPWFLRWLLNRNGKEREPAVLHDYLYRTRKLPRDEADALFRDALKANGVGPVWRAMYWSGVRGFGWWRYYGVRDRIRNWFKRVF